MAAPTGAQAQMGAITGSVDDAATGAVLAGICVYAYPVSAYGPRTNPSAPNPTPYEATTAVDGSYEMGVPDSGYDYVVRFDPSCGGTKTSPYAPQYAALGQLDFQSANAVDASVPATGVDAHLVPGFSISGTVKAPGGATGAAEVCVSVNDTAGYAVNNAETAPDGTYQVGSLPAGTYSVYFDPTCGRTEASAYSAQYYDGAVAASAAKTVDVQADVSGIDAQLVDGATVSGTVTAPGAANYAGICTYAIGPYGAVSEEAVTSAAGAYRLADLAPQAYTIRFDPTCSTGYGSYFGPQDYPQRLQLSPGESLGGVDGTLAYVAGTPLAVTQASLAGGKVYDRYYHTVSVNGPDTEGYPWQVTGLPRGLSGGSGVSFSDEAAAIVGEIYRDPPGGRDLHGHGDGQDGWHGAANCGHQDLQVGCAGGHPPAHRPLPQHGCFGQVRPGQGVLHVPDLFGRCQAHDQNWGRVGERPLLSPEEHERGRQTSAHPGRVEGPSDGHGAPGRRIPRCHRPRRKGRQHDTPRVLRSRAE